MKTATITMRGDTAEILLYDQIGVDPFFGDGISAKDFREQVKAVKAKTINLRINSPGGSVTDGAAMLNALDEHPARIEVDVDGIAASAASVIAMAGDTVRMASNGLMMIHNPYGGVLGDADEMRRMAELLDKVKLQILESYMRRAKVSREEIADMMSAETWFTGQEAVDAGLADEVNAPISVAASLDISRFTANSKFAKLLQRMPKVDRPPDEMQETIRRREKLAAILAA